MKTKKTQKLIFNILDWGENLFIFAVAVVAIFSLLFFIQIKILKNPLPNLLGYSYASAVNGDIGPHIKEGDLVIFKQSDKYDIGDIVVFAQDGELVISELSENGKAVVTQTNNNDQTQAVVFLGKMVNTYPKIGYTIAALSTPQGASIGILSMISIYLFFGFAKKFFEIEDEKLPELKKESSS